MLVKFIKTFQNETKIDSIMHYILNSVQNYRIHKWICANGMLLLAGVFVILDSIELNWIRKQQRIRPSLLCLTPKNFPFFQTCIRYKSRHNTLEIAKHTAELYNNTIEWHKLKKENHSNNKSANTHYSNTYVQKLSI